MKTILIVCTLAMMQGFLDAYIPSWPCLPEIEEILFNLGLDPELLLNFSDHVDEGFRSIYSLISQVKVNIANSDAKGTDCLKQLSERLDEIRTSYEEELYAYERTVVISDIVDRLDDCVLSLVICFEKAPTCSDGVSCLGACENILYGDDTLNGGKINAFLREFFEGYTTECERIITKVNEINVSIPSCIKLN